jgi:hypothetical protein
MKVDKETVAFKVLMGSHLYGTATKASDFDYKAVCVPSFDTLLLNTRVSNRKEKPVGSSASAKMQAGETETEYIPIQVFFDDFMNGQTYALEMAFATAQFLHHPVDAIQFKEYWMWMMQEMLDKFLTKNVKKMVGYAVSQSKLYGLKTERYTAMKLFVSTVENYFMHNFNDGRTNKKDVKVKDVPELLELVCSGELAGLVKPCTLMNARGGKETSAGLEVCGKAYPDTNMWFTVVSSVKTGLANYGDRVKEFDGEGVDWKALSHAIRITEQVLELCTTKKLTFPRPNAKYLLDVKAGRVPLEEATVRLENTFREVDNAVLTSTLQERTPELDAEFRTWKLNVLRKLYADSL